MADVDAILEAAHLKNDHVREYVRYWAGVTGADNIEVVSADDDARLIQEALDAGEILPAGEDLYYSRSYYKDTARSEERTIVATSNPADKGVYNNWYPAVRDEGEAHRADDRGVGGQDHVRDPVPDVRPRDPRWRSTRRACS